MRVFLTDKLDKRHRGDLLALAALLVGVLVVVWQRAVHDDWLTEYDIFTYFLPWYGMLGERLRDFDIPGWTTHYAAGSPLAGDPSGGWWYALAMLPFALLGPIAAFKTMLLLQVLVGGVATYLLGRAIGFGPLAAVTSASAFAFGPFLFAQTSFGTVAGQVSTWIPIALLGVECSLRTPRWLARAAWWGLAGVAISQIAVAWPGQGLINGLLIIGGWVAYRAVLSPPVAGKTARERAVDLVTTGPAVLALGLLLGAAGILPRLAVNAESTIPGGDYTGIKGGNYLAHPHSLVTLLRDTLVDDPHFRPVGLGGAVVALALLAVVLARRRYAVPFFAGLLVVAGILSMSATPLYHLMALLPGFETIHEHSPRRILWIVFIAPAMLAGAAMEALSRADLRRRELPLLLLPPLAVGGAALYLDAHDLRIGWWPVALVAIVTILAALALLARGNAAVTRAALAGLVLLAILSPAGRDLATTARGGGTRVVTVDEDCPVPPMTTYLSRTDVGGAGEFLQRELATAGEPFRIVSYAGRDPMTKDESYSTRRCDPAVLAVLLNGRTARLGLESVQGYNPLHLASYVDLIDAMNGGAQDYHWVDPAPAAFTSPLLDLLNVRYILVDATLPPDDPALAAIVERGREVFRNARVVVYENRAALPRAWIVHDVRADDGNALEALGSGQVDPRKVAFVDGPVPEILAAGGQLAQPLAALTDRVTILHHEDDALAASVVASGPGLVAFSEIDADGWRAWVDGEPAEILRTDHTLRGVAVTAGSHTIEMRYDPPYLRLGLWTSGLTGLLLLGVTSLAVVRRPRATAAARAGGQ